MDDTFELLTKMFSEFSEFRKDMNEFRNETNSRFDSVEARMSKVEIGIENDIKPSLQALHERAAINTDKLQEHSEKLDTIQNNLDYIVLSVNSQDKRLEVVEGRKMKAK